MFQPSAFLVQLCSQAEAQEGKGCVFLEISAEATMPFSAVFTHTPSRPFLFWKKLLGEKEYFQLYICIYPVFPVICLYYTIYTYLYRSSIDFSWLCYSDTLNAKAEALSPVADSWQPFFCVEPGDGGHDKRRCQPFRGTSFPFPLLILTAWGFLTQLIADLGASPFIFATLQWLWLGWSLHLH